MNLNINLLLFLIFCNINFSQNSMNLDILQGIKNPNLVGDTIKLEKNTFNAFNKMQIAAKNDGVDLKIASAHTEFKLKPSQAVYEIIRFSTIPGTSRHHWGTEIDIIDSNYPDEEDVLISKKFEKDGIFFKVKNWLNINSEKFGFYITYNNDPNRKGFEYEPWHYSYAPISKKMLSLFLKSDLKKVIKKEEIKGSEYFTDNFIEKYKKEYILDINKDLK